MILFNVCSSTVFDSGKNILLARSASGSYFIFTEPYCLNPYRTFYVWPFESLLLIISKEPQPPALQIFHTQEKNNHPFQIPATLSTVHRHIFIFWKQGLYDLRWRGENTRLILHRWGELMVFIQFIFFTLCTLIHKDANLQLVLCFTLHWFSRETYIMLHSIQISPREI